MTNFLIVVRSLTFAQTSTNTCCKLSLTYASLEVKIKAQKYYLGARGLISYGPEAPFFTKSSTRREDRYPKSLSKMVEQNCDREYIRDPPELVLDAP